MNLKQSINELKVGLWHFFVKSTNRLKSRYSWPYFKVKYTLYNIAYRITAPDTIINLSEKKNTVVPSKKSVVLKATGLRSGTYTINIKHNSKNLFETRKGAFITISSKDKKFKIPHLAKTTAGQSFSYIGSGYNVNDEYVQFVNFSIDKDVASIDLTVHNLLPLSNNFEISIIYNGPLKPLTLGGNTLSNAIQNWIKQKPAISEAEAIIYADIDLNVADGSSIWFSSMINVLSSKFPTVVVAKAPLRSNIITSNFTNPENVFIFAPDKIPGAKPTFSVSEAIEIIRLFDGLLPKINRVVVRGLYAAKVLHETRQFRERSLSYLTDFYTVDNGKASSSAEQMENVSLVVLHSGKILTQTKGIEKRLAEISRQEFDAISFPPPIPDELPSCGATHSQEYTTIGYAGKISPQWGVEELLHWTQQIRDKRKVELKIVANKISAGRAGLLSAGFPSTIRRLIAASGAEHFVNLNRQQSMELMASMDYVWCWRPSELEDNTLELSTKLVEMVAAGARCICYPSSTNIELLGEDYPFFIRNFDDFQRLIRSEPIKPNASLSKSLKKAHSLSSVTERLISATQPEYIPANKKNILFAGHDFKFIDPFYSHLKKVGHSVQRDEWEWGQPKSIARTKNQIKTADIIFCEWGLANAVWHSNNKRVGTKLYIRAHLQEINPRARKFGSQIKIDNVDKVIFVQEEVRLEAIRLWNWPKEKTCVIPNFVLSDEYRPMHRENTRKIRLGMVGIIPQRKRFDRAIDVLTALINQGFDATLAIKGPRPETIAFMQAPGRAEELVFYQSQYNRLLKDKNLQDRVTFDDWGNDVALWYQNIDYILSPSDFESFHYALADGVLSGCHPVIWPWDGAAATYTSEWVVEDGQAALERIIKIHSLTFENRTEQANIDRNFVIERYGHNTIFAALKKEIGIY